jgi:hypothetical protein
MVLRDNVPGNVATPGVILSSPVTFCMPTASPTSSTPLGHASTGRITPRHEFLERRCILHRRILCFRIHQSEQHPERRTCLPHGRLPKIILVVHDRFHAIFAIVTIVTEL